MVKRLKNLKKFNWIVLVLIFLVVIAGSFVRVTGSGMGCPDWPKCFGSWVPPTSVDELDSNYQEKYVEYRVEKIDKFSKFLTRIGLSETASQIKNDPDLVVEQPFNAAKTWIEYANRLCGFLAGNAVIAALIWLLLVYRKRKLLLLAFLNLVIISVEGWFGSIVVASNLVPWTITIHMLLALVNLALQLYIIHLLGKEIELHSDSLRSSNDEPSYQVPKLMFWILVFSTIITAYQIFLGTQVREMIDEMTLNGIVRENWTSQLGVPFIIHRTFSWLVLIFIAYVVWMNEKLYKFKPIRWAFVILVLELLVGIVLAYANMPAFAQITHLVLAIVLFCIFIMMLYRIKKA